MTDKQIIIDGVDVSECDERSMCINCESVTNCYYKQLKRKEQECEKLKARLKPKLKNAHCVYFEGQTGICKAKEFTKCNPVNCKLYTIDELSTIVDLQTQLDQLKAENEELRKNLVDKHTSRCFRLVTHREYNKLIIEIAESRQENSKLKQALEKIEEVCKNGAYDEFKMPLDENSIILDIINNAKEK